MNTQGHYLIADTQSRGGFFAQLLHVTALNAIVLFRHSFGYRFIGPFIGFVVYWVGSTVFSVIFATLSSNPASLFVKVGTLLLFVGHYIAARLNLWLSNAPTKTGRSAPRNADFSGISWISVIVPNDEWRVFLIIEPLAAITLGVLLAMIDLGVGLTLSISALALALKNWLAYNKYCIDTTGKTSQYTYTAAIYRAAQGAMGGVGTHYRPTPQHHPKAKKAVPKPRLRGAALTSTRPNVSPAPLRSTALPHTNQSASVLGQLKNFFSNGKNSAAHTAAPHTSPTLSPLLFNKEEQDYARLLEVPATGIRDAQHLKELVRRQLKKYHTDPRDSSLDQKTRAHLTAMTRQVIAARNFFETRLKPPVGLQQPMF
jgi:hypothetical protein